MKIKDSNGNDLWMWVVSDFDGDSFREGEVFNPPESAETLEELLVNTTEFLVPPTTASSATSKPSSR